MKNKIGILTFQKTVNYGAQFQNFALQEYIKKITPNVEVIDYLNEKIESIEKPRSLFMQRNLKEFIKFFKCHKYHVNKWKEFEKFRKEKINLSKRYDKNNINDLNYDYDGIIVGSDQVWNLDITNKDYTYYLDFKMDDNKKYSYAASFGFSELPISESEKIIKLLNSFKYVNLREQSALQIVANVKSQKNSVLDPTFLLSKEEWVKKMGLKRNENDNYIFVYMIDESEDNLSKIYNLAKSENLDIIHVRDGFKELKNVKSIRDVSPYDFMNLLYNAKYVVVGSFHGLCLSLIFQKNFYYVLNNKYNRNARLIDLLNIVELNDRNDFSEKYNIDYHNVQKKLSEKIDSSKQILNEMVREINEE